MKQELHIKNRNVGFIEDGQFTTHRDRKYHLFIKANGYPISEEILQYIKLRGINLIKIIETDENNNLNVYTTSTDNYLRGELIQEGTNDVQRVIPITDLIEIKRRE